MLAIYRAQAQTPPLHLTLFERHPLLVTELHLGERAAVSRRGRADRTRRTADRCAKRAPSWGSAAPGISYRRDQWHMPVMALGQGGDLLMVMAERGSADDCVEHRLSFPLAISCTEAHLEGTIHGP